MGWEVHPEGLYQILCRVHFDYGPRRIFVTENGASWTDAPGARRARAATSAGASSSRSTCAPAAGAIEAGVPLAGLLRLVAPRQLRVGSRVSRSVSASSGSTTPPSAACPRTRRSGTAGSSRETRRKWTDPAPHRAGATASPGVAARTRPVPRSKRTRRARRAATGMSKPRSSTRTRRRAAAVGLVHADRQDRFRGLEQAGGDPRRRRGGWTRRRPRAPRPGARPGAPSAARTPAAAARARPLR